MNKPFIADKNYKKLDFTKQALPKADYEACIFENCNFSEGYLDNQNFMECQFIDCNLSNANLTNTVFKEVVFKDCKLTGLKFEACSNFLLSFKFDGCNLNLSSFYQLNISGVSFNSCNLIGADFTQADISGAIFAGSDLKDAIFQRTNLQNADLRTAVNIAIDPEQNALKNARFSYQGAKGLLTKYQIYIEGDI